MIAFEAPRRVTAKQLWYRYRYAAPAAALVILLIVITAITSSGFFQLSSITELVSGGACVVILAMASTIPMLSGGGGIDISLGPFVGVINVVIIVVVSDHDISGSPWELLPLILGIALLSGAIIGFLISYVRMQPIVVTLGAYLSYSALSQFMFQETNATAPAWLNSMSNNLGPLPGGSVFIMAALLLWFGVSRTSFYDQLYAVGDNEVGAFTSGIAVQRVRLITYILSAVMAAIAALALTSFLDAASATIGPTLTLTALAGAALGGTSLRGGRGGVFGGLVGGTAIYLIQNVLSVLGVASYWITFTFGALLLVAIAVNAVVAQAAHSSVGST